jgi:GDP-L-fucose synthase
MRIFVAGHRGMVGSAVVRALKNTNHEVLTASREELNLLDQSQVEEFFASMHVEGVIDAAARVGGILANATYPYTFLMENLGIQQNLIQAAVNKKVQKFVFLGSSCIYPKFAPQPLLEEALLTGPLEPTNEWYAIAKIAGVKAMEAVRQQYGWDYSSLMPTNLYGPGDNFDLQTSHVLPAMIRKFHDAKLAGNTSVTLWGSGSPFREFLHVDDLSQAVLFAVQNKMDASLYNVGYGSDLTIRELASIVQRTVDHSGAIEWDSAKPDGTPKKLMDSSKMKALGWAPKIALDEGITQTYQWFLGHQDQFKQVKINA